MWAHAQYKNKDDYLTCIKSDIWMRKSGPIVSAWADNFIIFSWMLLISVVRFSKCALQINKMLNNSVFHMYFKYIVAVDQHVNKMWKNVVEFILFVFVRMCCGLCPATKLYLYIIIFYHQFSFLQSKHPPMHGVCNIFYLHD